MLTCDEAKVIAQLELREGQAIAYAFVRELYSGWYFPFGCPVGAASVGGLLGVIVNKLTGKVFELGSGASIERDLVFYDRGYQFCSYDLVILEVRNREATLDALEQLRFSKVEPKYEHGTVWRIPRRLSRKDLAQQIDKLPCVFGPVSLYMVEEILESARTSNIFRFEALEYSPAH